MVKLRLLHTLLFVLFVVTCTGPGKVATNAPAKRCVKVITKYWDPLSKAAYSCHYQSEVSTLSCRSMTKDGLPTDDYKTEQRWASHSHFIDWHSKGIGQPVEDLAWFAKGPTTFSRITNSFDQRGFLIGSKHSYIEDGVEKIGCQINFTSHDSEGRPTGGRWNSCAFDDTFYIRRSATVWSSYPHSYEPHCIRPALDSYFDEYYNRIGFRLQLDCYKEQPVLMRDVYEKTEICD